MVKIEKLVEKINNDEEYRNFLKVSSFDNSNRLDKRFAIFKDEKGDFNIVEIYINMGKCFSLKSKNQLGEETRIYEYIFSS